MKKLKIKNPYKKAMDWLQDHGHPQNYVETKKLHDRWETLPPLLKILHRLLLALATKPKWSNTAKSEAKRDGGGTTTPNNSKA